MTQTDTESTTAVGSVTFVAYGPGDPGLISHAGVREVLSADVLVVDSNSMIEDLALVGVEPTARVVEVHGDEVEQLRGVAEDGLRVVRLAGGDFFSDTRHRDTLTRILAEKRLRTHLIPGVSPWTAALSYGGISPVEVVTTCDATAGLPADWPESKVLIIRASDASIAEVAAAGGQRHGGDGEVLELRGLGTTSQQSRLTTWKGIDLAPCGTDRFLLVGSDVADTVQDRLDWFESKPLFDWKVLVPRTKDEVRELSDHLARYGATTEVVATMSIEPPRTEAGMEKAVRGIVDGRFLWLVFTSPHSVVAIMERLAEYGLDSRALAGIQLAAVGRGTVEALARVGIKPDLVPLEGDTARDLALEFPAFDDLIDPMNRVLVPTADVSVTELIEGLGNLGWEVEEVTAYRTVRAAPPPSQMRERIKTGLFDAVVFTSSTAVRNMIGIAGKPHAASIIAAIGPATAEACRLHGLRVDVMSEAPSFEALAAGLARFADQRRFERMAQGLPDTKPSQRRRRRRDARVKEG
ncbi:MAG: bifunctional uroporphyrinogen-III C-methyltransferase/uroporphyrinogen-III synthase [Propionibacteriaceae bacterium]|nr:bifunctional uroporphyrinogen-III C-methyltransferase/uroporphyrinogen-III synthase [Propionibacteriaceae bacterium]